MRHRLPLVVSVVALVVAVLGTSAPAIAHGVQHALFAHDSDKVDGIHASKTRVAGRLLPLNSAGQFPAAAIPAPFGKSFYKNLETFTGCGGEDVLTEPITIQRRSAVFVLAEATHWTQSSGLRSATLRVDLKDSAGNVVARTWDALAGTPSSAVSDAKLRVVVSGVLQSVPGAGTTFVAGPGSYSLVLHGGPTDGACSGGASAMDRIALTYFLVRPTQ